MNAYDAFISYNSQDAAVVHALAEELRDTNITCWLDVWSLTPGRTWQEETEDALRDTLIIEGHHRGPESMGLEQRRFSVRLHRRETVARETAAQLIEQLRSRTEPH